MSLLHFIGEGLFGVGGHGGMDGLFYISVVAALLVDFTILDDPSMFVPTVGALNMGLEVQAHIQPDHEVTLALTTVKFLSDSHGYLVENC